ncbi:uncharacterized protein METZ01_LOCUS445567, partial [marine metagenome]
MKISISSDSIEEQIVDYAVIPYFEKTERLNGDANHLNNLLNESISKLISDEEITGKLNEVTIIHTFNRIKPKKILILGMGDTDSFNLEIARTAFGKLSSTICSNEKSTSTTICLDRDTISNHFE